MNDYNIEIGKDNFLSISNLDTDTQIMNVIFTNQAGDELSIGIDEHDAKIRKIECENISSIEEKKLLFENEDELFDSKQYFYPNEFEIDNDFKIIFNRDELDIVFDEDFEKSMMCLNNNRLVMTFDDNYNPIYLRIKDLTLGEYYFLKQEYYNFNTKRINEKELFDNIEKKENITVLLGCLIGSRNYDYNLINSDYDYRFVYVRPYNDYLSLQKKSETIDYKDDDIDVSGWDLSKFLLLLSNQNVTAYEILYSFNQIKNNEYKTKLRNYSKKIFDKDKIIFQYIGNIDALEKMFLKNKEIKKFLHLIVCLCIVNYIQEKNEFPICSFYGFSDAKSNKELIDLAKKYIMLRRCNNSTVDDKDDVDLVFKNVELVRKYKHTPKSTVIDYKEANELLLEGLSYFKENVSEKKL